MPRPLRENVDGGIYHVFARGNRKVRIYVDDADRAEYLRRLGKVATESRWRCLAYCLMQNHVHLLIETPEANLSRGMQRLHGFYAQTFNMRHGFVGHLFQGRYGAVRSTVDGQLQAVVGYIARNPVEAGLCRHPEDWPWSSHGAVLAGGGPTWLKRARLLTLVGGMNRYLELTDGGEI